MTDLEKIKKIRELKVNIQKADHRLDDYAMQIEDAKHPSKEYDQNNEARIATEFEQAKNAADATFSNLSEKKTRLLSWAIFFPLWVLSVILTFLLVPETIQYVGSDETTPTVEGVFDWVTLYGSLIISMLAVVGRDLFDKFPKFLNWVINIFYCWSLIGIFLIVVSYPLFALSLLPALAGFVIYSIVRKVTKNGLESTYKAELSDLEKKYAPLLEEARKTDSDNALAETADIMANMAMKRMELQPKIDEQNEIIRSAKEEIEALNPFDPEEDLDEIDLAVICERMSREKIASAQDALFRQRKIQEERRRKAQEENRRKEEEFRRQEEERRRREEERRRNSPASLTVCATEDGKGKNADVYINGGYYGAISWANGQTNYQLAPGYYNVSVVIHSQGYQFQSAPESVYLEGGDSVTLNFAILGYNRIRCTRY
ncbi:MAG: YIP1 family protein [Clostridia bacterium]|nr:YIP1 family protein [Clostridia bacterium]